VETPLNFGLDSTDEPSVARPSALSVSQLTSRIKDQLESNFSDVVITGEISNFKAHSSGHFYFSLKDEGASITAVMFRGSNQHLKFTPNNGQMVLGVGKISVYPPRGNYQIIFSRLEPAGVGALQLAFEQLKAKLQAEGLFDSSRKKAIPKFPTRIGVVTSPTGAAIQDMLNVLGRRFGGVHIQILPVKVQGDGSAAEVAQAIGHFNQFFPEIDVLIVGRGGGSLEDLWAFNEEVVARAIANSSIPVISAVGHEIDFTIADFVADLRAPTPSAAAELVVADRLETLRHLDSLGRRLRRFLDRFQMLQMKVDDLSQRVGRSVLEKISRRRERFQSLRFRLTEKSPLMKLKEIRFRYESANDQLRHQIEVCLKDLSQKRDNLDTKLRLLNPKSIMERGYSLVRIEKTGKIVRKVSEVQMGDRLLVELSKGKITARVSS
jgi:exodeoxyribonuclease VII large subunit